MRNALYKFKTYLLTYLIGICDVCLDLSIECFEKARRSRPLKPLQALKDFRIIYDGSSKFLSDGRGEKSPTRLGIQSTHDRPPKLQSPVRRARSLSPLKDSAAAAASRDTTRGKTTSTAIPKSTSMNPSQPSGKEKRPLQESTSLRSDPAKQGLDVASATRIRQGRRAKEVGTASSDSKANGSPSDERTKSAAQRASQTDSTRGKTAPTSTKPAVNLKQSNATSKELQSQKKRVAGGVDNTDDNPSLPSRGS